MRDALPRRPSRQPSSIRSSPSSERQRTNRGGWVACPARIQSPSTAPTHPPREKRFHPERADALTRRWMRGLPPTRPALDATSRARRITGAGAGRRTSGRARRPCRPCQCRARASDCQRAGCARTGRDPCGRRSRNRPPARSARAPAGSARGRAEATRLAALQARGVALSTASDVDQVLPVLRRIGRRRRLWLADRRLRGSREEPGADQHQPEQGDIARRRLVLARGLRAQIPHDRLHVVVAQVISPSLRSLSGPPGVRFGGTSTPSAGPESELRKLFVPPSSGSDPLLLWQPVQPFSRRSAVASCSGLACALNVAAGAPWVHSVGRSRSSRRRPPPRTAA